MDRVEIIADFLCNGLEHSSQEEAISYLVSETKLDSTRAGALVADYIANFSTRPIVLNDELFPFIERYL